MMRLTFRRRYFGLGTLSCVAVFCFMVYSGQRSEELWTTIQRGEIDLGGDNTAPSESTEPYDQVLEIIPPFWQESAKANQDTDDVLFIDERNTEWQSRLPNALIIGVRKGGTRALLDILARHPGVKACQREVHFFDREEIYQLGLNWYRSQMPPSLENHITIEKTPAYFVTSDAPRLVNKMSASVKLLVVVRDPTVRAISDYAQLLDKYHGKVRPFEEYVTEVSQHSVQINIFSKIVNTGVYIAHLKNWLKYFPFEQIHFVNGEQLVKDPVQEIRHVEKFLGLEAFIDEKLFYFNKTKGFPCLVPASKRNGEKAVSGCLSETKGRPHPAVSEDVVTLLRDYYRPLNKQFYTVVGNDFGWL